MNGEICPKMESDPLSPLQLGTGEHTRARPGSDGYGEPSMKFFFSFVRYLNCCPDIFGLEAKRLDKKAKVNFIIYDAIYKDK